MSTAPRRCDRIYETGRGGFRVRSVYTYDKDNHCIDVTEIPYTTTLEAIIDKVTELVKAGKLREISRYPRRDRSRRPQNYH